MTLGYFARQANIMAAANILVLMPSGAFKWGAGTRIKGNYIACF
jgi:hypothetical protein